MKVKYNVRIDFILNYECEDYGDLRTADSIGESIGQLVADECSYANGVATYKVKIAEMKVNNVSDCWKEHIEKRFNSLH